MSYTGSKGRRSFKNKDSDPDSIEMESNSDIPFVEAHEDIGEIPLDQLDSFVVPARDRKGAFVSVQFNVPPYLHRAMQLIVRSNRFPFLDVQAFIRHAIYRNIRFCTQIRKSVPQHLLTSLDIAMEECRDQEFKLGVLRAKTEMERQVSQCIQSGHISDAIRLINTIRQQVEAIPESDRQKELKAYLIAQHDMVVAPDGRLKKAI